MNREALRAWLHQAALDVARLAERRDGEGDSTSTRRSALQAWVDAGIDLTEAPFWQAAGCADPGTARALKAAGVRPRHLLEAEGQAWRMGSRPVTTIASAVVAGRMTIERAVAVVAGLSLLRSRSAQRLLGDEELVLDLRHDTNDGGQQHDVDG